MAQIQELNSGLHHEVEKCIEEYRDQKLVELMAAEEAERYRIDTREGRIDSLA